jgi:uncharacterized protein YfkK (UPF0435 family)
MINKLMNLANYLGRSGFKKEADDIGLFIKIAGKLESAIHKYPSFEAEIRRLIAGVRPGHFEWALEELVDGNATPEELIPVLDRFQKIRSNLERDDLYQYPAINILRREVNRYGPTSAEVRLEKKERKRKESDIIYSSDNFKVIWPKTEFASCQWTGFDTTWCVSAEENNMYDSYAKDNVFLYFVLNKNLPEDDPFKRISLPTKGDLGILRSEVRNATDDHIGVGGASESIGEEFNAIEQSVLEHSKAAEFTENIKEDVKHAVRLIKNKENINVKELASILDAIGESNTADTYWSHLLADSLSSHPNLAETLLNSNVHSKNTFRDKLQEKLNRLSRAVPFYRKASSDLENFGLDIYLIENHNIKDEAKLNALTSFFIEDIDVLTGVFPVILDHLLRFQSGKKAVFDFLANDLLPGEAKALVEGVDDATLLYLFNAGELDARDQALIEGLGELLISRGVITNIELGEKMKTWSEPDFDW